MKAKQFLAKSPVEALSDRMIKKIKEKARVYTNDNFKNSNELLYLHIENAMLIGAGIAVDSTREEYANVRR